jgi:hypothetical protein
MRRGTPIPGALAAAAVRLARVEGIRRTAKILQLDRGTVRRYLRAAGGQTAQAAGQGQAGQQQGGGTT